MKNKKGFTLIELLIVIGILAVLAITVLLALNPAESQRKNRDLARIKDAGTLATIVDQYIEDNPTSQFAILTAVSSMSGNRSCTTAGWFGGGLTPNVCNYAQQLPIDPANAATRNIATGGTAALNYMVRTSQGRYRICVRQESISNNSKVLGDGGPNNLWFETGTDITSATADLNCP